MSREALRALLVELGHRARIPARVLGAAGRDGVAELFFDRAGRDEAGRDAPRVRPLADAGVVGDDVRCRDEPCRLDGDELRIPGTHSDAVKLATHSRSWASALTAEAAMAEPPRRPRTVRYGMLMPC